MPHSQALLCKGVCKSYGRRKILKSIDISMDEGAVLGLLGPNGAGKTTLMKSILGLVYPESGEIAVFGKDVCSSRKLALSQVGAIIEAPVFTGYLSGYDNLRYLASLTSSVGREKIMETLELVGLKDAANMRVETYSFGMKQRLGIAQSLLPDSKLLVLDEPTNGLDPHGIAGMRRLLKRLSSEFSVSIIVSSHLLHEIEQVCSKIVILHQGEKILDSSSEDLARMNESVAITVAAPPPQSMKSIEGFASEETSPDSPELAILRYSAEPGRIPELVNSAVAAGARIYSVSHEKLNLENIFIDMTAPDERNVRIDSF